MGDETYIWICRWEEFQHYAPDRDRVPAWIKSYTKQLDDERYLGLTMGQRGLLDGLRIAFSRARGRLPTDTRQLTHRLSHRVLTAQLEALNHAGLIEFVSRETLDQRLEQLYARARPRTRGDLEVEVELEKVQVQVLSPIPSYDANGREPNHPTTTNANQWSDRDSDKDFFH